MKTIRATNSSESCIDESFMMFNYYEVSGEYAFKVYYYHFNALKAYGIQTKK